VTSDATDRRPPLAPWAGGYCGDPKPAKPGTGRRGSGGPAPPSPRPEHFPHLLPQLTDGRIVLRAWTPSDGAALTAMARDDQCQRWCIGLPRPYTLVDARHFIGTSKGAWELWGMARLAAVDATNGTLLASVAVKPLPDASGEMGYMTAPGARGGGFTAAALRLLAGWAFDQLHMQRLEALIQPANVASIRTAERAGFTADGASRTCCSLSGERREHAVYVLNAPGLPRP
jgi:RimJ/RimL family protein N-acetyltransferase